MNLRKLTLVAMLSINSVGMMWSAHASEEDLYDFLWLDPDKSVYVLQNKVHKKKRSFYVTGGGIKGISSKYQSTLGGQLKTGYFFTEELAAEVSYSTYNNTNNTTHKNLGKITGTVPFIRRFNQAATVSAIYAPFYGKINTFNKIFYFDWYFGVGLSYIDAESNSGTVLDSATADQFASESYMGVNGKSGLRFHLSEKMFLDLEYSQTMYQAYGPDRATGKSLKSNSDVILSIGISF